MSKLETWHSVLIAIGLACLVGVLFFSLFCAAVVAGFVSAESSRPRLRVIEVEQPSQAVAPIQADSAGEPPQAKSGAHRPSASHDSKTVVPAPSLYPTRRICVFPGALCNKNRLSETL